MYSKHFGFDELPFSVTPDPRFFYSNAAYQDVLAGLEHGIKVRNGFVVVTGDAGTGKTTLLHRLICSSADTIEYALIINPCLNSIALLRTILMSLGLPSSSVDRETLSEQLNSHLRELFTQGRSVALLFDEAQSLSDEVLEEFRLPGNQETDGATLTSIVLMGQPELERRLDHSKLRQIKQRITSRRRLVSLPDRDVGPYVTSRLKHVGYKGDELFQPAALERIISWSGGIPRLINTICDNALLLAYQASELMVTASMIDEVANHLRLVERSPRVKMTNEVADQLRLIDWLATGNQRKIEEIANQPRLVDKTPPSWDQKTTDETADQPHFVDHTPIADQEKIDEVANQPRFVDKPPPSSDQKAAPEIDSPQHLEKPLSVEEMEADNVAPADGGNAESLDAGNPEPVDVDNTVNEPMEQDEAVPLAPPFYQPNAGGWRDHRFGNVNGLRNSIGALMILVVLAWGLMIFYPRQREAAVPGGKGSAGSFRSAAHLVAAAAKPIADMGHETMIKQRPEPTLNALPPLRLVRQDRDQNPPDTPRKQQSAEAVGDDKKISHASEEIYRVSGASFLRNKPTADAQIIDTLKPGIRIVVTGKSGEYFRVRSLSDAKLFGFVHKEDAFFDRVQ